jgi:hypothetical protein
MVSKFLPSKNMKYFDDVLDMYITEVETRNGFKSAVKRIYEKHWKESYPIYHDSALLYVGDMEGKGCRFAQSALGLRALRLWGAP